MDTIFMKSVNSKTSEPDSFVLNFADKINVKRRDKCIALSIIRIRYRNKKIKISAPR